METKICTHKSGCNRELPIENFELKKNKDVYYRRTICKKCRAILRKDYFRKYLEDRMRI